MQVTGGEPKQAKGRVLRTSHSAGEFIATGGRSSHWLGTCKRGDSKSVGEGYQGLLITVGMQSLHIQRQSTFEFRLRQEAAIWGFLLGTVKD